MRRLMLGAATAAIAITTSCSALGRQVFKEPIVRLQNVRVNGVGLTGGNLDVRLSVYNPNGYRLDASQMTYNLLVGDSVKFAEGTLDSRFTVNSNDSSVVTIPVSFTYAGIGAAGRQLLNTGGVNYRVTGEVRVGTAIGSWNVPYSSTGRFNALGGTSRQ
jgi:LEA14-like dessication related protein